MSSTPDSIEQSIVIEADVTAVYDLVSTPGWWINEGAITDNRVSEGEVSIVTHAKYGSFRVRRVARKLPGYVAFGWSGGDRSLEDSGDAASLLVEFWVEERPGGAALRVRESGFQSLPADEAVRRRNFEDNSVGWGQELAAAKAHLESS